MGETIVDGRGKAHEAGVNSAHELLINGVTTSAEHYTNLLYEDSYNMLYSVAPSANGKFLHLKNGSTKKIICEGFSIRSSVNTIISIQLGMTGIVVGGTPVVPANLSSGSGTVAVGEFQTGRNLTGMSGGVTVANYYVSASDDSSFRNFDADIIVPQNQSLCMYMQNGAGPQLDGFLVFWHDNSGR